MNHNRQQSYEESRNSKPSVDKMITDIIKQEAISKKRGVSTPYENIKIKDIKKASPEPKHSSINRSEIRHSNSTTHHIKSNLDNSKSPNVKTNKWVTYDKLEGMNGTDKASRTYYDDGFFKNGLVSCNFSLWLLNIDDVERAKN